MRLPTRLASAVFDLANGLPVTDHALLAELEGFGLTSHGPSGWMPTQLCLEVNRLHRQLDLASVEARANGWQLSELGLALQHMAPDQAKDHVGFMTAAVEKLDGKAASVLEHATKYVLALNAGGLALSATLANSAIARGDGVIIYVIAGTIFTFGVLMASWIVRAAEKLLVEAANLEIDVLRVMYGDYTPAQAMGRALERRMLGKDRVRVAKISRPKALYVGLIIFALGTLTDLYALVTY